MAAEYEGRDLEIMLEAGNYHRWILEEFRPFIGGDVVEVGAGAGAFSRLVAELEVRSLTLLEPSPRMFERLTATMGDKEGVRLVNETFGSDSAAYDAALYINVLEHIEDDERELGRIHEALRPSGFALVYVPALEWLYGSVDREVGHVRRYERATLRHRLAAAGFAIRRLKFMDLAGIVPWYCAYVLFGKRATARHVALYDRLAVPVMRELESWGRPPIGKNLLAVAQKV